MQLIVSAELVSSIFVIISLVSQYTDGGKLKSSSVLRLCSIFEIIWLISDTLAYLLNGPAYPESLLFIVNFLAFTMGGIVFLSYIRYCYVYMNEKDTLKLWIVIIPAVETIINEIVVICLFFTGRIITIVDGYVQTIGGVPVICQLFNIVMLIYLPVVAFTRRKTLGIKAVSYLGLYGFAPLFAIVISIFLDLDFTVVLGAAAIVICASLIQRDEAQAHIRQMNEQLEMANNKLQQTNDEQESQLEEIKSLNDQLQDNQVKLEEASAEQESQLEEIATLNKHLNERQHYTDSLYQKLMKIQACGIVAYKIPSHEVLVMNDMAKKMYGLSANEELDDEKLIKHISNVKYDEDKKTKERLRSIKNPGDQYAFSMWINNDDDENRIHVYVITQLTQMENGDLVIVSSLLDITEITKMERITAQANAANTAKTAFLFNMSHDIRTPMNAIIGYTELLEKNIGNPEKESDYLEKIKSSSDFLLSLINNVLEMARIESGKAVLDEEILSTGLVTTEVKNVYEELMKEKNITFIQNNNLKTSYVFGDKVKLNEVFLNLISNAYKYTPAGGSVTVTMEELPCEKMGWTILKTTVADTGIGMSKEYLPNLFEEFSREHNATDAGIQGTGLGMPIVKKLVDLMGGTITVESTLGKGSTFVVTIPHRIAAAPEEYTETDAGVNMDMLIGRRVLLAEDNDYNAEIAMELLSDAGLIVERAEDGIICVDMLTKAENGYYDVILMDIQMPNMDGYKATEKIRRLPDDEKANIPIVAMTANAFEEDKQNALNAGMNGHLAKPVNITELMTMLKNIIKVQGEFSTHGQSKGEEIPAYIRKIILDMQCSKTVASLPGGLFAYEAGQPEKLIYANEMACKIWGCDSYEELNTLAKGTFSGLVHPDDYENVERDIWAQIENNDNHDLDQVKYRIIKKDGSLSQVDDFGRIVRDKVNGDVFYVFVAEN